MIGTLLRNELRMLLRDTRTLLIAVVAPLLLFPLFIVTMDRVEDREQERLGEARYSYAIAGPEVAWADSLISDAVSLELASDSQLVRLDRAPLTVPVDAPLERVDSILRAGDVHLVAVGRMSSASDSLNEGLRVVELRYRANSDLSRRARDHLAARLVEVRGLERDRRFATAGFPVPTDSVFPVRSENVATAGKEAGLLLGQLLIPFLVLLMISGGSIVAADTISGEKERGTLETLLTTAAGRGEIVQSKLLAIAVVGLVVALVNVANLVLYLKIGLLELPADLSVRLTLVQLGALALLFLPLAALVAAALLLLSGIARSYREYQIYFFPLFLVFLLPSLAALLPGVELRSAIVAVPISGIAVATTALLVGEASFLWGGAAFASTALAAGVLLARTQASLSNERLISQGRDEADFRGGAALFPRHVLAWFLGLWVIFFLVSLWFGEQLGLRGSIIVNLVGIFLGGAAFLLERYRLDPIEALSLRRPHWSAWPATLIGAPSLLVLGIGLSEVVNRWIFPVPESIIEAFGRGLTLDVSLWQLTFFLAVLPGILEEIAFRGVLLHGLRKALRSPIGAALACGAIFGLFHVSLFRIIPTGVLGIALAAVVIRTGSIYPAMLWHFLNNAMAILPAELGWITLDASSSIPLWVYLAAGAGALVSLLIFIRSPRPPGMRPHGRSSSDGRALVDRPPL